MLVAARLVDERFARASSFVRDATRNEGPEVRWELEEGEGEGMEGRRALRRPARRSHSAIGTPDETRPPSCAKTLRSQTAGERNTVTNATRVVGTAASRDVSAAPPHWVTSRTAVTLSFVVGQQSA
jgi:hypothetical protein